MSASLARLMDCDKYLLACMVYYHLPPEAAKRDFESSPMPLSELIELIPWDECGSANPKGADGTDRDVMRRTYEQHKRVYDEHAELHDLRLTGYVNDNRGRYATSQTNTSFVAMSFRDDEDNGIVVYSGCETRALRPMAIDYAGCFVASLGKVTEQHRMALRFFDHAMEAVGGERGIIGHSKGGNLATYVFINRLEQPTQAYCINAQPYCWWAMNDAQKAALKSDRYEFIAHAGDVVHHVGYVSYVSRIVQMNPYLNRSQLVSLHDFSSMEFDSMGNLEGSRVLRTTRRGWKSRVFGDACGEQVPERDAVLERFRSLLAQDMEPPRLLSVALEETCLATHVDTVLLLMRESRDSGDILYTLQARGDSALRLRDFRLRLNHGDPLTNLLSQGLPVNVTSAEKYESHFLPLENVLGWHIGAANVIPLGGEDTPWFGALELLNKERALSAEDFSMGVDLAKLLGELPKKVSVSKNDRPLLRLTRAGVVVLEIERHACRKLSYRFEEERDALLRLFVKGKLASDEVLWVDGWQMEPQSKTLLHNWRERGVAVVGRREPTPRGLFKRVDDAAALTPQEASVLFGFEPMSLAALKELARPTKHASLAENADDESATLRARLALCLLKHPALIVFDAADCRPENVREINAYLHLLCYDKLATVLILNQQAEK